MMIDIDVHQLDAIVRAWLKDTLETVQHNEKTAYVHLYDAKEYTKDIKALKRLLEYVGEEG